MGSETLVGYTTLKYHQWKNTKFGNDQNEASVKPMDLRWDEEYRGARGSLQISTLLVLTVMDWIYLSPSNSRFETLSLSMAAVWDRHLQRQLSPTSWAGIAVNSPTVWAGDAVNSCPTDWAGDAGNSCPTVWAGDSPTAWAGDAANSPVCSHILRLLGKCGLEFGGTERIGDEVLGQY